MLEFELTSEQEQLRETARRFAADEIIPVAARYDEEQRFPEDVARKAWELGLMNLEVPRELGGLGLGVLDTCIVLEQLNYGCAGITNAVPNGPPRRRSSSPAARSRGAATSGSSRTSFRSRPSA
jgi:alkylation response protein AidB-like acyl-CoA dehydrogenase